MAMGIATFLARRRHRQRTRQHDNDKAAVEQHVCYGGCLTEFRTAMSTCDPCWEPNSAKRRVVDVEACVKATAALRQCFGRNPEWFQHQFIKRLDSGLDQDLKSSPEQEQVGPYRWWTGMRRS